MVAGDLHPPSQTMVGGIGVGPWPTIFNRRGTYIVRSSTAYNRGTDDLYESWRAMDSTTNRWHSSYLAYVRATGIYQGGGNPNLGFFSTNGYNGDWIQLQLPSAKYCTSFTIRSAQQAADQRSPRKFRLFGSMEGTNWTQLYDESTGITNWTALQWRTFTITSPGIYSYYRFAATEVGNFPGGGVNEQTNIELDAFYLTEGVPVVPLTNTDMLSIANAFTPNKSTPHAINSYYRNGPFIRGGVAPYGPIPTSGEISFAQFRNASTTGYVTWLAQIGGTALDGPGPIDDIGNQDEIALIPCATQDNGVVVVTYYNSSSLTTYNANGSSFLTLLSNAGSFDACIVKYNVSGVVQWIARIAGTGNDFGASVIELSDTSLIVVGSYASTLTAYNANGTAFGTTLSGSGTFAIKYNASGTVQWVTRTNGSYANSVTQLSNGNFAICGTFRVGSGTVFQASNTAGTTTNYFTANFWDGFLVVYNSSGTPQWAARLSGGGSDYGEMVSSTTDGGIVVVGTYQSSPFIAYNSNDTIFGSLVNAGDRDGYVCKYNSSGTVQWIARISGADRQLANAVVGLADGGIIVGGIINSGSASTFYSSNGTAFATTLTTMSNQDAFICKWDSSGIVQWCAAIKGFGSESIRGLVQLADASICVFGHYSDTTWIYNANQTQFGTVLTRVGGGGFSKGSFLINYSNSGTVNWFAPINGEFVQVCGTSISPDKSMVYLVGTHVSNEVCMANANQTVSKIIPSISGNGFICKYASAGTVSWVGYLITSTSSQVQVYAICGPGDGSIIATGIYPSGTLTAYSSNDVGFNTLLSNSGGNDVFIVEYNSSGTVQWVARIAGTGNDVSTGICALSDNGAVVIGYYDSNTLTALNANGTSFLTTLSRTGTGSNDIFVCLYSAAGVVQWIARIGGTSSDIPMSVCAVTDGGIIVGGYYQSSPLTAFHANNTSFLTTLALAGSNDGFIVKYNSTGTVQWVNRVAATGDDRVNAICNTADGGFAVTGRYDTTTLTIYNTNTTSWGTLAYTSSGANTFIIKYDTNGTPAWSARLAPSATGTGICQVSDGGIVVTGNSGSVTAYNANGTAFATTLSNGQFVCKYNSSGTVQWIARIGAGWNIATTSISSIGDGGLIVSGWWESYYSNSVQLTAYNADGSSFSTTMFVTNGNTYGRNGYIVKYNTSGVVQWIAQQGSSASIESLASSSTSDGGTMVAGFYNKVTPLTAYGIDGSAATLNSTTSLDRYNTYVIAYKFDATPPISGLVIRFDASNNTSYIGTGSTWTNIAPEASNTISITNATFNTAGYFTTTTTANGFGTVTRTATSRWTKVIIFRYTGTRTISLDRLFSATNDQAELALNGSSPTYNLRVYTPAAGWTATNLSIASNTWYIVVVYYSSVNETGNIKVWVNGGGANNIPSYSTTIANSYTASFTDITIGARWGNNGERVEANYQSFLLYNRELTNSEVRELYNFFNPRIQAMP